MIIAKNCRYGYARVSSKSQEESIKIGVLEKNIRFKFPYNLNFEKNDNEMFSKKFCCCIVKVRKKKYKMEYILSRS